MKIKKRAVQPKTYLARVAKKPLMLLVITAAFVAANVYIVRHTILRPSTVASTAPICLGTAQSTDFKCWDNRLRTLTREDSPAVAFADLKDAYAKEPYVVSQCHQFAHRIGRAAATKYNDIGESYRYGDNFCWSGYYHGVMEAMTASLGKDYVFQNIATICDKLKQEQPYSFYHFNCVHGLGHGVMGLTDIELFESLSLCQKMSEWWEQESCYGGVFMENIMSEDNEDHGTKYLFKDQPMYPCTAVGNTFKNQCYLMQTSYALKLAEYNFETVFMQCEAIEQQFVATCYQSIGRDASGSTTSDPSKTKELCLKGTTYDAQSNCIVGAVKDFISYFHNMDQANVLCDSLGSEPLRQLCQTTGTEYYKTF
ncbi:MAG: hypothetical protein KIH63_003065 [Candidatus Saccharibacteria bacterium]|nr:hypothetical protein [Candidatus Saccharibacteria bacterium]